MAKVVAFDFPLSLMYFHINNDRCIILIKLRRCLFEKIHRFQFIIFSLLSEIYWNIIKLKITGHVWNSEFLPDRFHSSRVHHRRKNGAQKTSGS